ncbi:MAG: S8 family serine peptidase [Calditrichaeota bacterium]|nr:S8 family serine peptidase [Calditrichota bacterium]
MFTKVLFTVFLSVILLTTIRAEEYRQNEILFCIKADRSPLIIQRNSDAALTNNPAINRLLKRYGVIKIEKWLPMADDKDVVNGVKLANIYRAVFKDKKSMDRLKVILNEFRLIDDVHSAALEAINRVAGNFEPYIPNDPYFERQWYLKKIGAPDAWGLWQNQNKIPGDSTVLVGVVDTGVDYTHPDLAGALFINPGEDVDGDGQITEVDENGIDDDGNGYVDDFMGWDFAGSKKPSPSPDNDVMPPNAGKYAELSHGTHVSGIIAAVADNGIGIAGISFRSKIIVTKHAFDDDLTNPGLVKGYSGILYCAKMGAKIINCSWSGGYDFYGKLVVDNVTKNYGAIVVAAAGNDSRNNDNNHIYPSDFDNTISVAALRIDDRKAYYSNFGNVIDISAPGGEGGSYTNAILSTIHVSAGSYTSWQGTSMASPVVAGAFALLKAWFPDDDRDALVNRLLSSADPIDDMNPGFEGLLGSGRVSVYNAIAREFFPKISLTDYKWQTTDSTPPQPGDSVLLNIQLKNAKNWADAFNVRVNLSSPSPYIKILDSLIVFDSLPAGKQAENFDLTPRVLIMPNTPYQKIPFQLKLTANDTSKFSYSKTFDLQIWVSAFQNGFPLSGYDFNGPLSVAKRKSDEKVIVAINNSNQLVVFDAKGKALPNFPIDVGSTTAAPVVADLENDGQTEIITVNREGVLRVIGFDGKIVKEFDIGEPVYGDAVAANLDDDPQLEIVFGTMRKKLHALNLDSTEVPGFPKSMPSLINLGGALADFNGDKKPDIVIGTFDYSLHIITSQGDSLENFPVALPSRLIANPLVGKEKDSLFIIVSTLDNKVIKINKKGVIEFEYNAGESVIGSPAIVDLNQDGDLEIIFVTQSGKLYVLNSSGSTFGDQFPLNLDGAPKTGPLCLDVDSDGLLEILVVMDQGLVHLIRENGSEFENFPADLEEGINAAPVLDDLDGDGDTEIIAGGNEHLFVLDLPTPFGNAPAWSTYQGNNRRTGTFGVQVTAISSNNQAVLPDKLMLLQNYPNPFNSETVIQFYVPARFRGQNGKLTVYNVLGEKVFTYEIATARAGLQRVRWNGVNFSGQPVSSGIYFYSLTVGKSSAFRRMLLLK